jgi:alkylhydroperoxidase/carboxymuconolactone decarboxylase family protein YurZ
MDTITHLTFNCGGPKSMSAITVAKEVFIGETTRKKISALVNPRR